MANRIAGNILIIDSAMGNKFALQDITGGNQFSNFMVNAIAFWSVDSTGALLLTGASTTQDIIFKYDSPAGSAGNTNNPKWFPFGQSQDIHNIKCPVVTSGTAFLYLV